MFGLFCPAWWVAGSNLCPGSAPGGLLMAELSLLGGSNVKQAVSYEEISRDIFKPERIWWLPPLMALSNAGMVGLLVIYTWIGLKPILPPYDESQLFAFRAFVSILAVRLLTAAGFIYLRPVFAWVRLLQVNRPG